MASKVKVKCRRCIGKGWVRVLWDANHGNPIFLSETCGACGGEGFTVEEKYENKK